MPFCVSRRNRKFLRFRARFRKGCELVSDGTPTETEAPERSEGIDGILSLPCLFACYGGIENSFDSARGFGKVVSDGNPTETEAPERSEGIDGTLLLPCLFMCRGGIAFDSARDFGKVASLSVTETQPKPKLPSEAKGSTAPSAPVPFCVLRRNRKFLRFRARFRKGYELVSDRNSTETEAPERSEGIDGTLRSRAFLRVAAESKIPSIPREVSERLRACQ